jgi:hypothetical protein
MQCNVILGTIVLGVLVVTLNFFNAFFDVVESWQLSRWAILFTSAVLIVRLLDELGWR